MGSKQGKNAQKSEQPPTYEQATSKKEPPAPSPIPAPSPPPLRVAVHPTTPSAGLIETVAPKIKLIHPTPSARWIPKMKPVPSVRLVNKDDPLTTFFTSNQKRSLDRANRKIVWLREENTRLRGENTMLRIRSITCGSYIAPTPGPSTFITRTPAQIRANRRRRNLASSDPMKTK